MQLPIPNDHEEDTLHVPCPTVPVCLRSASGLGLVSGFAAPPYYQQLFTDILLGTHTGGHFFQRDGTNDNDPRKFAWHRQMIQDSRDTAPVDLTQSINSEQLHTAAREQN